jgi:hypothetical protein
MSCGEKNTKRGTRKRKNVKEKGRKKKWTYRGTGEIYHFGSRKGGRARELRVLNQYVYRPPTALPFE